MDSDYVQNLRYKLQKRVRRLNSTEWQVFHFVLKQFWGFLIQHPILSEVVCKLEAYTSELEEEVESIFSKRAAVVFDTEMEGAVGAYMVLKRCVESDNQQIEVVVGRNYSSAGKMEEGLDAFRDMFVEPFYEYIDEQLDDSGLILALLRKYKHRTEWFRRAYLYDLWASDTARGEKNLALDLYEYLFNGGIDFAIEPVSASGEVDLVASQISPEPLIADAKIFDPGRSKGTDYIAKGFRQIYSYTLDYNQPVGYLIIYKTCEHDLKLPFANEAQATPFVQHNNKTIFFVVVDLYQHDAPASKRGKLKYVELVEEKLWEDLDAAPKRER